MSSVDRPPRSGPLSPALELCLRLVSDYLEDRSNLGGQQYIDARQALQAIRTELEASYRPVWTTERDRP